MAHVSCNLLGASALALLTFALPASAQTLFTETSDGFQGSVTAGGPQRGKPVIPGGKVVIRGDRLIPGQEISLLRGTHVLNSEGPLLVDAEGKFSYELQLDADAMTGLQPLVVVGEKPAAATVVDLKISPDLDLSGADRFSIESVKVGAGLYQVAFTEDHKTLFVTSAVGRPPVKNSALYRLDAATLEIVARAEPAEAPARPDGSPGGLFAFYGLDVDNANGTVWTTNTRQNTVSVYRQDDLSLVKQFDEGAVSHARDVVVDEARGRAYVSTAFDPVIEVFDTGAHEKLAPLQIKSLQRGKDFGTMSLHLDEAAGRLYTVSMTDEYAVVNLADGSSQTFALPGSKGASGVAYDPVEDLLFVAAQQSDNLLIVKASEGRVLSDTEVGAGALNVTFEPKSRLAYVANRGSGTITVVDTKGAVVAVLDAGNLPNHLEADGEGNVWAVNKSAGENDDSGDRLWRITPKAD